MPSPLTNLNSLCASYLASPCLAIWTDDPHAYAKGWVAGDEGHFQALTNLEAPNSKESLFADIEAVLTEQDSDAAQEGWTNIFQIVHDNNAVIPMWGKRNPAVVNTARLANYRAGYQQFDYPVWDLTVVEGDKTVTIAPGAQSGLFQSVGRLE